VVECRARDEQSAARFYLGGEQGFAPLGGAAGARDVIEPSRAHVAQDGSAIVLEQPCPGRARNSDDGEWCVLDAGRTPRTRWMATAGSVLAVRAGRVLFERGRDDGHARDLRVVDLASPQAGQPLSDAGSWRHVDLGPDGSVYATTLSVDSATLVRVDPSGAVERRALPARDARVFMLDARRWIAASRDPVGHWESVDAGAHWSRIEPAIVGASSIAPRHQNARRPARSLEPDLLGGSPDQRAPCTRYACALDDGLVYADPSWLAPPAILAARRSADRAEPPDPRDRPRPPVDRVWFCGEVARASSTATDVRDEGDPGAGGWLSVQTREGELRPRWFTVNGRGLRQRSARWSRLAPADPSAPARGAPSAEEFRLRLATDEYAVIERCAGIARCDVLFARRDAAVTSLLSPRAWLSGPSWPAPSGRLHAVEPLDDGGFALWLTRVDDAPPSDRVSLEDGAADVVLTFDSRANLQRWRAFSWRGGRWAAR
jgi:hypothetical protein